MFKLKTKNWEYEMREEHDIQSLNPGENPYVKKKQITINIEENIIIYFKKQANKIGVPYQTLINLYLRDCVKNDKNLEIFSK